MWLFDDLRCDPGDSLSRAQFEVLLTSLGANLALLPQGIPEAALEDVSQYVQRLWGAVIGHESSLQGLTSKERELIVRAYGLFDQLGDSDYPLSNEQRHDALGDLRTALDHLVAGGR